VGKTKLELNLQTKEWVKKQYITNRIWITTQSGRSNNEEEGLNSSWWRESE
jgi:hypothetical protein